MHLLLYVVARAYTHAAHERTRILVHDSRLGINIFDYILKTRFYGFTFHHFIKNRPFDNKNNFIIYILTYNIMYRDTPVIHITSSTDYPIPGGSYLCNYVVVQYYIIKRPTTVVFTSNEYLPADTKRGKRLHPIFENYTFLNCSLKTLELCTGKKPIPFSKHAL